MLRVSLEKHEVAHRHAARVEPHHERRHRAGRHERPRPVDVADRLRHRLGHVRSRMEVQLHQRHALDVPRLDVVDAGDVEKVVLVIVGQVAFHLRRVHAAIGLGHVDHRQVEAGKDVDRHEHDCQQTGQRDGRHGNDHRNRTPQRRLDQPHKVEPCRNCNPRAIMSKINIAGRYNGGRPLAALFGGFVRMHVLYHAAQAPVWGAAIMAELQRHGYRLTPGTLYPILHQLEAAGWLAAKTTVVAGKRRKNYRITAAGRKLLRDARGKLRELVSELLDG